MTDPVLYPNAGSDNATPPGPSRRALLAGAAGVGVAAAAGCTGSDGGASQPTVLVFNTGDGTVTVVDAAAREVVGTADIGATSSFPSNQYAPRLADGPDQPLWINVD